MDLEPYLVRDRCQVQSIPSWDSDRLLAFSGIIHDDPRLGYSVDLNGNLRHVGLFYHLEQ